MGRMNDQTQSKNIFIIFQKAKKDFLAMDDRTKKIVKIGLRFSFGITVLAVSLLITYLMVHNLNLFMVGFSLFKSSIFFHLAFIAFGIIFTNWKKQMN